MAMNPSEVAQKWASGMSNATQAYKSGVQSVTKAPTESALMKKEKYLQGVQDAYNSGKYERGLRRSTLSDWQSAAVDRGASRLASGASASRGKVQSFLEQFLPYVESVKSRVDAMPSNTYEERKAKLLAMVDGLHQFKRT